ncbi:MAG: hypothetical protein Q8927_20055, partial [Bacteroidota bacterium]|nr:hypothetical protein [Bacteroidota bacterium]
EIASFTDAGSSANHPRLELSKLPLIDFGDDFSTFGQDSTTIRIKVGKFVRAGHKIRYLDHHAIRIDNRPIYGDDGDIPKTDISSILVTIGGTPVVIPKSAYADLFEPNLTYKENGETTGTLWVYYSKDKRRYYINMSNGDGAGFYEATLIVRDKKYAGRVVDNGF